MELNKKKDSVQDLAIEKWLLEGKVGTIEAITGIGKMFIFLKALMTMPKNKQDIVHLFLAETTERNKDLREQIEIFNKLYHTDILSRYNLQFHCYQEVYKWKGFTFGLVGCDEFHDQLSPEYVKFHMNNKYDALITLSALIISSQSYNIKRDIPLRNFFNKDIVTKHDMVAKIAPICFKYTVNDGQLDDTSRKLNIYVINIELDSNTKNILAGSKHQTFYQTEASAYAYATKLFNEALNTEQKADESWANYEERRQLNIIKASNKRSKLLYGLGSKVLVVRELLSNLNSKTIIFNNDITSLYRMTPNVVCTRNSPETNDFIRNRFNNGSTRVIGSFKMLKQGANLTEVDNCILASFYSDQKDFIQRIGRLRQRGDAIGNVFVIVTKNTQEVVWFNKMVEGITEYNFINCENVAECIQKYKKNE